MIGTSSHHVTLMDMFLPTLTIVCGERQDQFMLQVLVLELIQTEIGITNG